MALWPNNSRNIFGAFPMYSDGYSEFLKASQLAWRDITYFTNDEIEETSSWPEGAAESPSCIILPIISGGMASGNNATDISLTGAGNLLSGAPIQGDATFSITGNNSNLSLIIGMEGDATFTLTAPNALLSLTIGLEGDATWSITAANANLGLIVPFGGDATFTITGTADLKGICSLAGDITPYTELSPENLAAAVWNALSSAYETAGTMGEKLNAAGTAGDPWTGLIEGSLSAGDVMRILLSVAAGETTIIDNGGGYATVTFKSQDGTINRIVADMSGSERISLIVDGRD